ncbi:hypothetical protein G5714_024547 [Onychostoma macrolepis]|uniref:Uncharacterized protein n=1 Tax=Onychostoma macrolepis TaxID=369639 RepID=A0A7J6BHC9_9TELE|nr:hypothetical protein G5714_024547 [Onychostoma macrolepis]
MSLSLASFEKPLELSFHRYRQPEGAGVVPTPPGRRVSGPGVARKSPWSLAVTVTENRTKGRWGSAHPARETCLWAWRRSKKPLELRFLSAQNLSPQNHTFNHFPTAPQTSFPNGPTSRVAVESRTYPGRGTFPSCRGASDTLDVWPKLPFQLRFPTLNSSRAYARTAGPRGARPRRTSLSPKRPRSLEPAAGDPKTLSRWHLKTASPNGPISDPRATPGP